MCYYIIVRPLIENVAKAMVKGVARRGSQISEEPLAEKPSEE